MRRTFLPTDPVSEGLSLKLIFQTRNSVGYEFTNAEGFSIHFICRLNVFELTTLVFLPAEHEPNYLTIYKTCLSYLEEGGLKPMMMGIFPEKWLAQNEKRLQIHFVRKLGEDFLFDAARRCHIADSLFGDMRAFLVRARNEISKTKISKGPQAVD
jgi:hypothetical protein